MATQRRQPGKRKSADAPSAKKPPRKKGEAKAAPAEAEATQAEAEPALEPEVLAAEPEILPPEPEEEVEEEAGDGAETKLPVPVERDLSRADALQRYMSEVARHPLLTREEEHRLATEFQKTQDPRLAYRLVTANLRLVVKIAHEYRRAAFNLLDLVQEGNVGLMHAVRKYDPNRGVKLSSYAAWWIRAYILRYLMDNWRMVKLGTTQAQRKLFFNLRKEQEKLLQQGFDAAPRLLAERLDVSEQDVQEMDQRLSNDEFSLDSPVAGGDENRQTYAASWRRPGPPRSSSPTRSSGASSRRSSPSSGRPSPIPRRSTSSSIASACTRASRRPCSRWAISSASPASAPASSRRGSPIGCGNTCARSCPISPSCR